MNWKSFLSITFVAIFIPTVVFASRPLPRTSNAVKCYGEMTITLCFLPPNDHGYIITDYFNSNCLLAKITVEYTDDSYAINNWYLIYEYDSDKLHRITKYDKNDSIVSYSTYTYDTNESTYTEYDANGDISDSIVYHYDTFGLLVRDDIYDSHNVAIGYDVYINSNGLEQEEDCYDNTGKLSEYIIFSYSHGLNTKTSWYDARGNLMSYVINEYNADGNMASSKTYDPSGNLTGCEEFQYSGPQSNTYSISGKITGKSGPLSGISVFLTGASTQTTSTGTDGVYKFSGLKEGTYSITSGNQQFTFVPKTRSITIQAADVGGQNFSLHPAQRHPQELVLQQGMDQRLLASLLLLQTAAALLFATP